MKCTQGILKVLWKYVAHKVFIHWLHSSDFQMHCIDDKVDNLVPMCTVMLKSTNVIREVDDLG